MTTVMAPPRETTLTEHHSQERLLEQSAFKDCELVNGEVVERKMGWESELFAANLLIELGSYCRRERCGSVNGANASYQCFEDAFPDDRTRIRKPDVSFIAAGRIAKGQAPKGHCSLVPDLCAEVISPNDLFSEVEEKVTDYLAAGVRLVWVVDPRSKTIRVHRRDGSVSYLRIGDKLSGEDVIPGFTCPVEAVFEEAQ